MVSSAIRHHLPALESGAERLRLAEAHEHMKPWYRWGPYLSERQWGTVREDYSPYGSAWDSFSHDHARSRTYRWGEDGLLGISDEDGLLCFALSLWNGVDPILKERLFGMIALELARENRVYEDVATKFFEHFLYIAEALNNMAGEGISLWDEEDQFFYDVLHMPDESHVPLKVLSLVGFIPLLAVETIELDLLDALPEFKACLEWFLEHKPHLASLVSRWQEPGMGACRLLALVRGHRMKRLLKRMLDPEEFLGDYGIRAVSRYHAEHPYVFRTNGTEHTVRYEPGESSSWLFGGNSNWRGPIWFPINFLMIETLQKFHQYYGDDFLVECPTGSGTKLTLWQIADELSCRLTHIFLRGPDGHRPVFGTNETLQTNLHWRDYPLFYEYFHGDTGRGVGASHQTGWTGLVAKLLEQTGGR